MSGDRLGLLSLRLDAAYCLVLGAVVAALAPSWAPALGVPVPVVAGIGVAVVLWAAVVAWMTARLRLRVALRTVMVANVVAAAAVAAFSATTAGALVLLAVLAVAADVGLFAGSQAVALRRLRTATPGLVT
ncbi:putative membrane protein YkgB [Cellulosimicrobium cellulans]|uniref:Histidine kinase n=1 Tax=Cellulosimicrobium cellulans TaxID=1710 RepID=A0A1Y0HT34_CELCE|nr:hypothetical protein [Cellulosimicrobium cellulans]ARU50676.1 hypothetical protein CBR64_03365 [Cellulosimicrobium cellulans]MBM7821053.1 putative membrane protein YkgB [Cellulosimicrobium cellulans]